VRQMVCCIYSGGRPSVMYILRIKSSSVTTLFANSGCHISYAYSSADKSAGKIRLGLLQYMSTFKFLTTHDSVLDSFDNR
jgi:hypothetical protein